MADSDLASLSSRLAVLATMHQKETVIAPLFAQHLGITVTVPAGFDSDRFGTFTRDIDRMGNQLEAARAKAKAVLEMTGEQVAIASEGAFFPDPMLPWMACGRELVLLIDQGLEIEIVGEAVSPETNFSHKTVDSVDAALQFAETAKFPSHGLVVMPSQNCTDSGPIHHGLICKGIVVQDELIEIVTAMLAHSPTQTVHLETDMRAMHNPTRMGAIAQATQDLITKIQQRCPQCGCPGFSETERQPGLPCSLCGLPTQLTKAAIHRCQQCGYVKTVPFPDGVQTADPGQCWNCNP
ncbi:MAG: hypothetical protein F6K30_14450 [Cyanothece sp. SIO2G6]|nr:hypothetical protein [Cyanothece sp. SIO2G6]